jgi:hypothetical protein
MHLVYSQGEEVTPENDGIELDTDEGCLHRLYRPHTFETFKKKYAEEYVQFILFDLTTFKVVKNPKLFMVSSYFIMPYGSIVFAFGEYL